MTQQDLHKKSTFTSNSTAKLWMQYLHLYNLLRQHGKLYLDAVYKMLPYFAACGHNNYIKPVWLYLQ